VILIENSSEWSLSPVKEGSSKKKIEKRERKGEQGFKRKKR
jgi:hypothetical protein